MSSNFSCDSLLLKECVNLAWQAQTLALPNPSVGALVVDAKGNIIGRGTHQLAGDAHAEVLAIKQAYHHLSGDDEILSIHSSEALHAYLSKHHQNLFTSCVLYVSLEPCNHFGKTPPCAALLAKLRFQKVCIGIKDYHPDANGGLQTLLQAGIQAEILESQEARNVLYPFLCLQEKGHFNLFKLAQRLDGNYLHGQISSNLSQQFTHAQRSVCDAIFISGQTLREDNPRLDSRFAPPPYDAKTYPKVGIFTKTSFALPPQSHLFTHRQDLHRCVEIPASLSSLQKGFHIIEGGWNLLPLVLSDVDMILLHLAPKLDSLAYTLSHTLQTRFKILHTMMLGEDLALWLAKL
ncbi:bifunctional diaminohydroxyphosphoribosylaminopyrimidine deaminase/5-amino-6-(5-phosphoribosylamino)uracil reductase RibD [Helicobacter sp. MIT 05-5293]|uniref:bifunctional diaminohydroxyphosphoribosylaminopyrimidine deaminase/5-amino-6-(5-phosphoribosylamino)uracil reductase RibD n=1 Tax=Helicobacter sp. MIT 05-5293 TaxID=1548149 RepID=UPI00051D1FFF|nr:bifunctional diaminohydroxyphosphoribosylaminopyrimidine deaminase/5-amino-6-(5-phosphoribosylamino)uracil reductase RibD [Helicobacter sp. MIT 05-5293]TLD81654.1 bifunctional diaminohydroxyphosphoribosylaminopyrimidine deaminase/5-amino-6-(5-phosphoribosylamino)uracil reductase RibD [Helicobacter sp. MIT 05-5293]